MHAGKRVLIVGSGSSGIDIAVLLSKVCPQVVLSQHFAQPIEFDLPGNLTFRPDIVEVTAEGALFSDGASCEVDTILYCTGFNYSFPFLSADCGIFVEDNHVQPLYKHMINIKYPTMALIGLTFVVCPQILIDLQSRFCLKFWSGGKAFPSAADMTEDTRKDMEVRWKKGWKKRHAHKMGELLSDYHKDLAETAEIDGIDIVYVKIFDEAYRSLFANYLTCRKDKYEIIDNETFIKV